MRQKNHFFIKNIKSVVLIGYSEVFLELDKINKLQKLNTFIISSSHQSKMIDKKVNYKVFDKIDNKFKKFITSNMDVKNTLFVSLSARYIFKKQTIENFFSDNLVNFHWTRLPLDSGGAPDSWQIMREDRINNQLVHLVDEGIDSGPIILNDMSLIPRHCQIPIDFKYFRLKKFIEFYSKFIEKLKKNESFVLNSQPNYIGRYNPRLNTEVDGLINWNMDSYDLFNFIKAFDDPYKGASTFLNNGDFGKLYIKKVHLHGGDSSNHPYMTGIVSRHDNDWLVVSTISKHMLLIEEVLDSKGRNIISKIKTGDRFYTPYKDLERSKITKTVFNSKGLNEK